MRSYTFKGNFLYYVSLIKKLYGQSLSQAAEKCGLTLAEADILSFLRENPQFDTARDVCVYREVSKGYVSKAVESLVKRGYLEITKDGNDRRIQHLKISGRAKNTANILHTAQFAFYENVTSCLTDRELSAMLSAIEKCAGNVAAEFKRLNTNEKPII